MEKRLKIFVTICMTVLFAFGFIGCEKDSNNFDENKAISKLVKHYPDFPLNSTDTFTKKIFIGGPHPGNTVNVNFSTKVEKYAESSYIITLIKDWGITVNGKYIKSSFKYKVTPDSIISIEIIDNDDIVHRIK